MAWLRESNVASGPLVLVIISGAFPPPQAVQTITVSAIPIQVIIAFCICFIWFTKIQRAPVKSVQKNKDRLSSPYSLVMMSKNPLSRFRKRGEL
jgi:hypothetical protein